MKIYGKNFTHVFCIAVLIICASINMVSATTMYTDENKPIRTIDKAGISYDNDLTITNHCITPFKLQISDINEVQDLEIEEMNYSFSLNGNAEFLWKYENTEMDSIIDLDWIKDMDGDGIDDIIVCNNQNGNGTLLVLSSQSGTSIWSRDFDREIEIEGNIGDVDSDGIYDFIIYSNEYNKTSDETESYLYLVSGSNGNTIWSNNFSELIQIDVDIQNINGDEASDLLIYSDVYNKISNETELNIYMISGSNGNTIWNNSSTVDGDCWVWCIMIRDDINGDGVNDVFVEWNCYGSDFSHLDAVSGIDGTLLWQFTINGYIEGYLSGEPLDLNEDGIKDYVTSCVSDYERTEYIFAFSGKDGSLLWNHSIIGYSLWFYPHYDVNNDGIIDIAVEGNNRKNDTGCLFIIDGKNGGTVWSRSYNISVMLDWWFYEDIDSDGIYDLVATSDTVQVLSGTTGNVIWEIELEGSDVMTCSDIDGDGKKDILADNYLQTDLYSYQFNITALSGINGNELWNSSSIYHVKVIPPEGVNNHTSIRAYPCGGCDLNGDGVKDPLLSIDYSCYYWNDNYSEYSESKLIVINGVNREEIWNAEAATSTVWEEIDWRCYDLDHNGVKDMILCTRSGIYAVKTTGI